MPSEKRTAPAPEIVEACIAAGLPVENCARDLDPPFWVRTTWTRPPKGQERTRAANIRAQFRPKSFTIPREEAPPPIETDDFDALGAKALAVAVISLALKDAAKGRGIEKMDAMSFLTDLHGSYAQWRERWCALADLDPSALRKHALHHFNESSHSSG